MKRAWLQPFTWAVIVETNRQLCQPKGALPKPTSDGYEETRRLWESLHQTEMTLAEATDLCRRCHRLARFCNFNGNTFVAVIRKVVSTLSLSAEQTVVMRSLAGHIVAGAATPEEQHAFSEVLKQLAALDAARESRQITDDELAGHHQPVAEAPAAGEGSPPLGQHPRARGEEHGLRGRTGEPPAPSRNTRPQRATRFIETTRGVLSYSEIAPLLAERVAVVQADIERGQFGRSSYEESLLLDFHRQICGDLVPDWSGRWRTIEVHVGNLHPAPPHLVPLAMREYCRDLEARWPEAAANLGDLTLEFLAFAEGRFLTVHPFQDFNGRVIRLFLSELLRRLDLPPVRLEPETDTERAAYFAALEAADQRNLSPLVEIWKQRLASSELSTA